MSCSRTHIARVRVAERIQLRFRDGPEGSLAHLRGADRAVGDQPQHRHRADAKSLGRLLQRQFAALGHLSGTVDRHAMAVAVAAYPDGVRVSAIPCSRRIAASQLINRGFIPGCFSSSRSIKPWRRRKCSPSTAYSRARTPGRGEPALIRPPSQPVSCPDGARQNRRTALAGAERNRL